MSAIALENPHELITESLLDALPPVINRSVAANDDTVNILLVDDDDVSVEWVKRCLKKYNLNFNVQVADDGQAALDILQGNEEGADSVTPQFILLDLNMPGMNGFEFLQKVRANPDLASLVVFILTTSDANSDRAKAFNEGVAGYLLKDATAIFNWIFSLLPKHIKPNNLLNAKHHENDSEKLH